MSLQQRLWGEVREKELLAPSNSLLSCKEGLKGFSVFDSAHYSASRSDERKGMLIIAILTNNDFKRLHCSSEPRAQLLPSPCPQQ